MGNVEQRQSATQPLSWARLWSVAHVPLLRNGAWYPVVGDGASLKVVLDVPGGQIAVSRRLVELRDQRPSNFTVVHQPTGARNPARGTTCDLGRTYAVCPNSGSRVRLAGRPDSVRCPECGHVGLVAWWETG
jgi:hypothetical protein